MEQPIKKTRKSVPRPNSGRRAVDGATDLVKVGIRLAPEQHEWVKGHGNDGHRQLIQGRINAERDGKQVFIVELNNGNWHTITRVESEAIKARDEWNGHHPGTARVFKSYIIEEKAAESMEAERIKSKLNTDYGAMTTNQKRYWRKQCERHGIPVPEGLENRA